MAAIAATYPAASPLPTYPYVPDGNNTRLLANVVDIAYLLNVLPAQLDATDFVI